MPTSEQLWLRVQARVLPGSALHTPASPRTLRRARNAAHYARVFVGVIVRDPGVTWRATERALLWGKVRRVIISCIPGLALRLKRRHGLAGGCISCGASCNLLFRCPHWEDESRLCSIYEDRPVTCRLFPITPADLKDRDLASGGRPCGYSFAVKMSPPARVANSDNA